MVKFELLTNETLSFTCFIETAIGGYILANYAYVRFCLLHYCLHLSQAAFVNFFLKNKMNE